MECSRFQPNVFNKTRCQHCFKVKEAHAAEALENHKKIRKVTKSGFLYVAPVDLNFNSATSKTKPDTVPHGIWQMTSCQSVRNAQDITGHQFSIELLILDRIYYVKGETAEDIKWWYEVLAMYAKQYTICSDVNNSRTFANKQQPMEATIFSQDSYDNHLLNSDNDDNGGFSTRPIIIEVGSSNVGPQSSTSKDRQRKSSVRTAQSPIDGHQHPNTYDRQPCLKPTKNQSPNRWVSDPALNGLNRHDSFHGTPRSVKHRNNASRQQQKQDTEDGSAATDNNCNRFYDAENSPLNVDNPSTSCLSPDPSYNSCTAKVQLTNSSGFSGSEDTMETDIDNDSDTLSIASTSSRSCIDQELPLRLPSSRGARRMGAVSGGEEDRDQGVINGSAVDNEGSLPSLSRSVCSLRSSADSRCAFSSRPGTGIQSNEGGAASGRQSIISLESDSFMDYDKVDIICTLRKGWMMLRGRNDSDWTKHWVVLDGASLRLYKDLWNEDSGEVVLELDLNNALFIRSVPLPRNYGIEIQLKDSARTFSTVTPGIRDSWLQALLNSCNFMAAAAEKTLQTPKDMRTKVFVNREANERRKVAHVAPETYHPTTLTSSGEDQSPEEQSHNNGTETHSLSVTSHNATSSVSHHTSRFCNGSPRIPSRNLDAACGSDSLLRPRSISPTVRRSPVSRIKEKDFDRRHLTQTSSTGEPWILSGQPHSSNRFPRSEISPAITGPSTTNGIFANGSHLPVTNKLQSKASGGGGGVPLSSTTAARAVICCRCFEPAMQQPTDAVDKTQTIAGLQETVELLRVELNESRTRLQDTELENERLQEMRYELRKASASTSSVFDDVDVTRIKQCLGEADKDMYKKQVEIDSLKSKLDRSVDDISSIEDALRISLKELQLEKLRSIAAGNEIQQRCKLMELQLEESRIVVEQRDAEVANLTLQLAELQATKSDADERQKQFELQLNESADTVFWLRERVTILESEPAPEPDPITVSAPVSVCDSCSSLSSNRPQSQDAAVETTNLENKDEGLAEALQRQDVAIVYLKRFCELQSQLVYASLKTHLEFLLETLSRRLEQTRLFRQSNNNEHTAHLQGIRDDLVQIGSQVDQFDQSFDMSSAHCFEDKLLQANDLLQLLSSSGQDLVAYLQNDYQAIQDEFDHWKQEAQLRTNVNLSNEIGDLEQELVEMQTAHSEEIEALRAAFQEDIGHLNHRLNAEVELRRRCQNEIQEMKNLSDQTVGMLEESQDEILREVQEQHRQELRKLEDEHKQELLEEKDATRQAIDSLRKAHEDELQRQLFKQRQALESGFSALEKKEKHQSEAPSVASATTEMLATMKRELSHLSVAYSTKCLELSQLEDELNENREMLEQLCKGVPFEQLSSLEKCQSKTRQLELALKQSENEHSTAREAQVQLSVELKQCKEEKQQLLNRCEELLKRLSDLERSSLPGSGGGSDQEKDSSEQGSDVAAEYTPKTARRRRIPNSIRRIDPRFHSSPNMETTTVALYPPDGRRTSMPEQGLLELRAAMGLPVAERRKFFESMGM